MHIAHIQRPKVQSSIMPLSKKALQAMIGSGRVRVKLDTGRCSSQFRVSIPNLFNSSALRFPVMVQRHMIDVVSAALGWGSWRSKVTKGKIR